MAELPTRLVQMARRWLWPVAGLGVGIATGFIALGLVQGMLWAVFDSRPWPAWAAWLLGNTATAIAGTTAGLAGLGIGCWFSRRIAPQ